MTDNHEPQRPGQDRDEGIAIEVHRERLHQHHNSEPDQRHRRWLRKGRDGANAAISKRIVRSFRSFAHRPKGDAAQQMAAQQDGEAQDRNEEQRGRGRDRGPVLAALADDEGDEGRHRLRVAAGEQNREGIFVPGEDQAEDRSCGDAGRRLRKHDLEEGLKARVAIDHRRLFVLARDFVHKSLQQPYRERDIHGGVQQDHPELGVGQPKVPEHQIDRDRNRNRRHHPCREDEEQQIVGERHAEPRERISRDVPKHTARKVEPKPMTIEFTNRGTTFDGPPITMLRERTRRSYQVRSLYYQQLWHLVLLHVELVLLKHCHLH